MTLSLEEAYKTFAAALAGMQDDARHEKVTLAAAIGRSLATEIRARRDSPAADTSAMDGYALRAADTPGHLALAPEVAAGDKRRALPAKSACPIFTGGLLPEGADTILIQEDAKIENGALVLASPYPAARWLRRHGQDFRRGDLLLAPPRQITTRDLALAATGNHSVLNVRERPAVALMSSGSELVAPGSDDIAAHQTPASSRVALAAAIRMWGGVALTCPLVPDDPPATRAAFENAFARRPRIILTTGGASVGKHDLMRPALAGLHGLVWREWFYKVAMKPGMPVFAGVLSDDSHAAVIIGAPGNPVSSLVTALVFLRPALRFFLGLGCADTFLAALDPRPSPLASDIGTGGGRYEFLRARHDENGRLHLLADQDSSLLGNLALSDCLALRPPNDPPRAAGAEMLTVSWRFAADSAI